MFSGRDRLIPPLLYAPLITLIFLYYFMVFFIQNRNLFKKNLKSESWIICFRCLIFKINGFEIILISENWLDETKLLEINLIQS